MVSNLGFLVGPSAIFTIGRNLKSEKIAASAIITSLALHLVENPYFNPVIHNMVSVILRNGNEPRSDSTIL